MADTSSVDSGGGVDAPTSVASWYSEGVSDGLGDRLRMFDNSGTTSLELLRFRPELVSVDGFEESLRDRVAQLRTFTNPAFPPVWAVDQLDGDRLALVSTFAAGKRLSEIFQGPREKTDVDSAFAAWLARDLTSALADLQRHRDGIAHGALTPERIVITPDRRLMIVEHVLGAALDGLKWPPNRLWLDLGLVAPENGNGAARLDQRSDVVQIGWIVLSVLVGRRLTSADYPGRVAELLDEFVHAAGPRPTALVTALRSWLERALQVKGAAFGSAMEAHDALFELRVHDGPQVVAFRALPDATEPRAHEPLQQLPPAEPAPPPSQPPAEAAPPPSQSPAEPASPPFQPPAEPAPPPSQPLAEAAPPPSQPPAPAGGESEQSPTSEIATMTAGIDVIAEIPERNREEEILGADDRAERRGRVGWIVAAALALVAVVEGVALVRLSVRAPATVGSPIVFESLTPGDPVLVNGWQAGVTPLTLTLAPDVRSIRVQSRAPQAATDASTANTPPVVDRPAAAEDADGLALAAARERRGGLRLVSPVELQVLEGERVLGSTADGPIVTTAGRHELDFINTAVGYRSRKVVDIMAGQIVRMSVAIPDGRLSVNAVPWAQVSIDGNPVGETPLANLPLAVGEHQITFRHPQLGEQTQRVIVKADALTRVSATLSR